MGPRNAIAPGDKSQILSGNLLCELCVPAFGAVGRALSEA